MRWPALVHTFDHVGRRYRIRAMDERDVDAVRDLYARYYPHLFRSSRHFLLERDFYLNEVAWASRWDEHAVSRPYFIGLVEEMDTGRAIFAFGFLKERHDLAVQGLAIVLDPNYRGVRLSDHYVAYANELVEGSGADYVHGTAQVKDVIAQRVALRGGLKLGGIMPGAFRWSYDGQSYYRDMLLYMYRFLNDAEEYSTRPQDWQLTEKLADAHHRLYEIAEEDLGK